MAHPWQGGDPARGDYQFLEDLATAHWYSEVLFAALELDLFTRLEGPRPRSAHRLARELGWDGEALDRLLGALVEMGLVVDCAPGLANSPLASRHLVRGSPHYLGHFLSYRRYIAPHWRRLPQRVRRGVEANRRPGRESEADYQERVLAYVRALDAQAALKAAEALELVAGWLPQPPGMVLDLGGGAGAWCRQARRRWPGSRALLLDLPEVIRAAGKLYPRARSWRGIWRLAGDGRRPPLRRQRFHLVIVSNLLHAYGEKEAQGLLQRAAACLAPGGALLLHDYRLGGHRRHPLKGRLYDLHMMLNTYNGRIYSLDHMARMLERAGLGGIRSCDLAGDTCLLLAQAGRGRRHQEEWDLLLERARELGFHRVTSLDPARVELAPWVRLKCRYGCPGYGQNRQCPPFSPDHHQMARILAGYRRAILVQGAPPGPEFHQRLLELERILFLAGFPKALSFGAGPCTLCPTCDTSRPCRRPQQARPALEACGVDVYTTARRAGWRLEPLKRRDDFVQYLGLVLVD